MYAENVPGGSLINSTRLINLTRKGNIYTNMHGTEDMRGKYSTADNEHAAERINSLHVSTMPPDNRLTNEQGKCLYVVVGSNIVRICKWRERPDDLNCHRHG